MSTYCISDIHGHLIEFKRLLKEIKFSMEDTLYLLGDYVDQGEESMELILHIIELQDQGFKINGLIGNHDLMMLRCLNNEYKDTGRKTDTSGSWVRNGGETTFQDFLSLSELEKQKIFNWLNSLNFVVADLVINNTNFYLSHAYPIINDRVAELMGYINKEDMAVWHRLHPIEDPFILMKDTKTRILVYGHTPTSHYLKGEELKIYSDLDTHKICIDCGGKGLTREKTKHIARLAALRLDDLAEFYVRSRLIDIQ